MKNHPKRLKKKLLRKKLYKGSDEVSRTFISFLKENNALEDFITSSKKDEMRIAKGTNLYSIAKYAKHMSSITRASNFIMNAFNWSRANISEGNWCNLHDKWGDICKHNNFK